MNYLINNYRFRKFGNKIFVTSDHGSFCVLSDKEFRKFRQGKIDGELKEELEKKEIIVNKNNLSEVIRLTRNRNNFLFSGTSLHIVVVTLRCNMNCVYCQASSKPSNKKGFDMTKETAKKNVDFIFQSPAKKIVIEFQGGEPLLNWNVVKYIVEYARKKNKVAKKTLMITLVSNLSKMDEDKMNYIIKNGISICTSLDGPKHLHDYNRKLIGGSNYDQVVKWIKKFHREYKKKGINDKRINALITLTKKSLSYPEEIVNEYWNLNLDNIHLRFLNNLGVAKTVWPIIGYSINEYLKFWKKAVIHIEKLKKDRANINERMVTTMINKIRNEVDPNYLDLRSPCGAAIGQLAYNYNGDIYTCDEARMIGDDLFRLGNVVKDKYKDVVTSDKVCATVAASVNDQYICNSCVYKPYCGVCPVCNYAEQGSIIGKITETDRCKIFMEQFSWVVKEKFIKKKK